MQKKKKLKEKNPKKNAFACIFDADICWHDLRYSQMAVITFMDARLSNSFSDIFLSILFIKWTSSLQINDSINWTWLHSHSNFRIQIQRISSDAKKTE